MAILLIFIPLLVIPFAFAFVVSKLHGRKRWTYLLIAVAVPAWPLILTLANVLPQEGFVLAGTSVLGIPLALFLQNRVNKLFS